MGVRVWGEFVSECGRANVCVSVGGVSVCVFDSSGAEARGQQQESVPFFLRVGAQVVRLGHKHIYLLSHPVAS